MNKLSERISTRRHRFTFYPRIKHARTNPRRLTHMNVFNEEHYLKAVERMKDSFEGLCWQLLVFNIYSSDCSPQCKLDVTDRLHSRKIDWTALRSKDGQWPRTYCDSKRRRGILERMELLFAHDETTAEWSINKTNSWRGKPPRLGKASQNTKAFLWSQLLPAKNSQQRIKNKQLIYDYANSFPAIWKRNTVAVITQRLMICVCSTPPIIAECLNFRMLYFMWKPWQEIKIMWCFYKDLQMHKW